MAKEKSASWVLVLQWLFRAGLYKSAQGRVTRQVTFATLAGAFALASWRLFNVLPNSPTFTTLLDWAGIAYGTSQKAVCLGVSSLLLAAGAWFSYRIVNYPRFADFLVAVEAEMNKVSWPSRAELFRSSLVVILVIFALAAVLFGYDLVWKFFFGKLGVLQL